MTEKITTVETWLPGFPGFYDTGLLDEDDLDYQLWDDPSDVPEPVKAWW